MADENEPDLPETDADDDAIAALPPEEFEKLKRGESELPKKDAKPVTEAAVKDEFEVDPKSETVPHSTFHRTNERRKAAEAETAKERSAREQAEKQANTAMQRLGEFLEAAKPAPVKAEEPPPEPDWDTNPIEAGRYARQRIGELEGVIKQIIQSGEQQAQQQQFGNAVLADVRQFKTAQPDYDEARNFYWNQRGPELMALGYTRQHAEQIIGQDEINIATTAAQRGQSPAATFYAMVKARGYQSANGAAAAPANGNGAERNADGTFKAAAAAMDKREATKQAAKSLGGSGGPADAGPLTAQDIVNMDEPEFRAFKKKWDKELGEGGAMRKIHELTK